MLQLDQTWTAATLPENDNVNPYAFSVALNGSWFISKGAMIAYYGRISFEAIAAFASREAWVAAQFSSPIYVQDWVVANGQGKLVLADRGFDVNSYDIDAGNLTIKATNLLAFDAGLELKQSIVPGFVTLIGTGTFLASSNGPVIFKEPPFRADPEALLGWADCPAPSHHHDAAWMAANLMSAAQGIFGRTSGEERQFDFTGAGVILLQSSEMTRSDPATLRLIESQAAVLPVQQKQTLAQRLTAEVQQSQQQQRR